MIPELDLHELAVHVHHAAVDDQLSDVRGRGRTVFRAKDQLRVPFRVPVDRTVFVVPQERLVIRPGGDVGQVDVDVAHLLEFVVELGVLASGAAFRDVHVIVRRFPGVFAVRPP